jgi:hypothetical protein
MEISTKLSQYKKIVKELKKQQDDWLIEIAEDVNLDENKLDEASLTRPKKYTKWLDRALKVAKIESLILIEKDVIYSNLHDYYLTESEVAYKATEITMKIKGHKDYVEVLTLIAEIKLITGFLEKSLENVKGLGWDIRNYTEWKKLLLL